MKPKDLKIGNVYTFTLDKRDYFIMLLIDKNSEDLIFATYNSDNNTWYIPDVWNYDYETNRFKKFNSNKFSSLEKQGIIVSLFREIR